MNTMPGFTPFSMFPFALEAHWCKLPRAH
ncbi:hypothetical protein ACEQPO_03450 [Bacillus sp. SL00103]